jgi:hypothetical protein
MNYEITIVITHNYENPYGFPSADDLGATIKEIYRNLGEPRIEVDKDPVRYRFFWSNLSIQQPEATP